MTDVVLLSFLDGEEFGDYRDSFLADDFDICLRLGGSMPPPATGKGGFDAAVLVAGRRGSALAQLGELTAAGPRAVICVVPAAENDEIALLNAGASLCLPPDVRAGDLPVWTRHLLKLAGRGWPADFDFDPVARRAHYGDAALSLRPAEFDILLYLARHAGQPMNAVALQRRLDRVASPQRLAVVMHNLRAALAIAGADVFLRTVPGSGYVLSVDRPIVARRRPLRRRHPSDFHH